MARVYIETTIPSFYHETRPEPAMIAWRDATRQWWHRDGPRYTLCTSQLTLDELAATPEPKLAACLELLRDVEVLELPSGASELAEFYVEQKLMPRSPDAAHLAIASLHGVDFVLTWNCRHLANANKVRHFAVLNSKVGLGCPVLTTPLTLQAEGLI